jgi:hypothetical protein
MTNERFHLKLSARIEKLDDRGFPIGYGAGGTLELAETIDLGNMTFTDLAGVLGAIHDMGAVIQERQNKKPAECGADPCEHAPDGGNHPIAGTGS